MSGFELISHLAWPVAVLLVVLLLRTPIAKKLEGLTSAEGPVGIKLAFQNVQEGIEAVSADVEAVLQTEELPDPARRQLASVADGLDASTSRLLELQMQFNRAMPVSMIVPKGKKGSFAVGLTPEARRRLGFDPLDDEQGAAREVHGET